MTNSGHRNRPGLRPYVAWLLILAAASAVADVRELEWRELMPATEAQAWIDSQTSIDHTGGTAPRFQSVATVPELDGIEARIAGFVVPVETTADGKLSEFFLVPFFGACIHVPPPPANQIIYGRLEKPIDMVEIWDAFWMQGRLNIEDVSNDTADAAYTMQVESLRLYE